MFCRFNMLLADSLLFLARPIDWPLYSRGHVVDVETGCELVAGQDVKPQTSLLVNPSAQSAEKGSRRNVKQQIAVRKNHKSVFSTMELGTCLSGITPRSASETLSLKNVTDCRTTGESGWGIISPRLLSRLSSSPLMMILFR